MFSQTIHVQSATICYTLARGVKIQERITRAQKVVVSDGEAIVRYELPSFELTKVIRSFMPVTFSSVFLIIFVALSTPNKTNESFFVNNTTLILFKTLYDNADNILLISYSTSSQAFVNK